MSYILVLYHSKTGNVKRMAHKIAKGVLKSGLDVKIRTVPKISRNTEKTEPSIPNEGEIYATNVDVKNCLGLIMGSPTHFGNMSAELKYFLDNTVDIWFEGSLINKPCAVFTSSASSHGGQESTLLTMMIPLLHQGAILCGLPYSIPELHSTRTGGSPYGASNVSSKNMQNLSEDEIILCEELGLRVANLAKKLL